MLKNTSESYGVLSRVVHWVSALTVLGLFALGLWMEDLDYYHDWYRTAPDIHRSVGVLLLILTAFRLVWYRVSSKPRALETHSRTIRIASVATHHVMILLLFAMFISGYLITTAQGDALYVFNWFSIPSTLNGIDNLEDIAGEVHELTAFTLIGLAALHAIGALKHHFIDKDVTLKRMLGLK